MTQVLYCGSLVVCGTYLYNLVSSITISQYPSLKTLRIYLFLVSHLLHILVLLPEILPSYPFQPGLLHHHGSSIPIHLHIQLDLELNGSNNKIPAKQKTKQNKNSFSSVFPLSLTHEIISPVKEWSCAIFRHMEHTTFLKAHPLPQGTFLSTVLKVHWCPYTLNRATVQPMEAGWNVSILISDLLGSNFAC